MNRQNDVGGVDCIGLALDLEGRAKTVESQTTERAMLDAAHGLRLLAAPAVPVGDGWLPIETAPKDNAQRILLCKDCGPGSLQSYSVGFFIKGWHGAECRGLQTLDDIGYRVTHWMPLPDYPPAPSVDGECSVCKDSGLCVGTGYCNGAAPSVDGEG